MNRRARPAWLPQNLLAHRWIKTDVDAAVLLEDELIELNRAVAYYLRCGQIRKPLDVKIRGVSESVSGVENASYRGVDLGVSVTAGDFDTALEKRPYQFHLRRKVLDVEEMLRRRCVLDPHRKGGCRDRKFDKEEMFGKLHGGSPLQNRGSPPVHKSSRDDAGRRLGDWLVRKLIGQDEN